MREDFELEERILAVTPQALKEKFPPLLAKYGVREKAGELIVNTIGIFQTKPDFGSPYYACDFMRNITPIALSDGRLAFVCYWNATLAQDFEDEKAGIVRYTQEPIMEIIDEIETITGYNQVALPPQFEAVTELTHEQFLALLPPPMEMPIP